MVRHEAYRLVEELIEIELAACQESSGRHTCAVYFVVAHPVIDEGKNVEVEGKALEGVGRRVKLEAAYSHLHW